MSVFCLTTTLTPCHCLRSYSDSFIRQSLLHNVSLFLSNCRFCFFLAFLSAGRRSSSRHSLCLLLTGVSTHVHRTVWEHTNASRPRRGAVSAPGHFWWWPHRCEMYKSTRSGMQVHVSVQACMLSRVQMVCRWTCEEVQIRTRCLLHNVKQSRLCSCTFVLFSYHSPPKGKDRLITVLSMSRVC